MKLTRRQILKIAVAAAAGILGPADVTGQVRQFKKEPREGQRPRIKVGPAEMRLRNVMKHSITDSRFRRLLLSNPDKALMKKGLTTFQKNRIKERVKLVNIVAFGLVLQIMRYRKTLRPLLLNPTKREALLFGPRQIVERWRLPHDDARILDKTRITIKDIYDEIFFIEPDIGLKIKPGIVGLSDTGCINNGDCSADSPGCTDDGCYDHWCEDNGCDNTGACIDERCSNTGCTDTDSCSDRKKCKNDSGCTDKNQCFAKGVVIDSLVDDLVGRMEEVLDRGPDLDFMVDVGQTTIQGATFLNPKKLRQALRTAPRTQDLRK